MARNCSICAHPKRLQIEQAMIAGASLRDIAGRFGTAKTIVARHRSHVAEAIARNTEARELARTGTLLEDVRAGERRTESLYEAAQGILKNALEDEDPRVAIQAIRAASALMGEARGYLELRGELTNELGRDRTPPAVCVQIISPAVESSPDRMPRITFGSADQLEAASDEGIMTIGVVQGIE